MDENNIDLPKLIDFFDFLMSLTINEEGEITEARHRDTKWVADPKEKCPAQRPLSEFPPVVLDALARRHLDRIVERKEHDLFVASSRRKNYLDRQK